MLHRLYTIKDRVSQMCAPVFQAVNDGVASRSVIGLLQKIPKYDWDSYKLVCVGEFDDESGEVKGCSHIEIDFVVPRFDDVRQRDFGFVEEEHA